MKEKEIKKIWQKPLIAQLPIKNQTHQTTKDGSLTEKNVTKGPIPS